jgi:hypothetical protein
MDTAPAAGRERYELERLVGLARTAEALIAYGHSPDAVFGYTPRRALAFLNLAQSRLKVEKAELLSISALASRGDPREVKKQLKELSSG